MNPVEFRANLKDAMTIYKLTVRDVARNLCVSEGCVERWLEGTACPVSTARRSFIAEAKKIPPRKTGAVILHFPTAAVRA